MTKRGNIAWFNGKTVEVASIQVGIFAHALHYGTGAFEGIRVYEQASGQSCVFKLKEHIDRLFHSGKVVGFEIPYSVDEICSAAIQTVKENGFKSCYIRPLAFISDGPLGVYIGEKPPVDVAIIVWEWGAYLGEEGMAKGVSLKLSDLTRSSTNRKISEAKATGPYLTGVIAKRDAISDGFDEALLLDSDGFLAEGTGENIFIVKNGAVKTTPPGAILEGITRDTVIEYLGNQSVKVQEEKFKPEELWDADEAFFSGTAAEITPIRAVDQKPIGSGAPGPLTLKLKDDFSRIVRGEISEYKKWLTPIK